MGSDFYMPILERMDDFFNARVEMYDNHMLVDIGLDEFYEEVARLVEVDGANPKLLDLGCGTGLELERLFAKYPDIRVTGIDIASEMLKEPENKYKDKNINLICGSYFDVNFGVDFDVAISTYSLHHFNETEKLALYKKVFESMKPGGIYIEGDYTVKTEEEQVFYVSELARFKKEQNLPDGFFYHYDTPMTAENQMKLLKSAGFIDINIVRQWDGTTIITAKKLKRQEE
jgi:tRNA (cmo5U34)-methyltransferase